MKSIRLILAAALLSTMPACETIKTVPEPSVVLNTAVCAGQTWDEKRYYDVTAAYNVLASAYLSATSRNLLVGETKATIKAYVQQANQIRLAARDAKRACDAVTLQDKLDAITVLKDRVLPMIPK